MSGLLLDRLPFDSERRKFLPDLIVTTPSTMFPIANCFFNLNNGPKGLFPLDEHYGVPGSSEYLVNTVAELASNEGAFLLSRCLLQCASIY